MICWHQRWVSQGDWLESVGRKRWTKKILMVRRYSTWHVNGWNEEASWTGCKGYRAGPVKWVLPGKNTILVWWFQCPLWHLCGCIAKIRVMEGLQAQRFQLDRRGMNSHYNDKSKYLEDHLIISVSDAVTIAPHQAVHVRRSTNSITLLCVCAFKLCDSLVHWVQASPFHQNCCVACSPEFDCPMPNWQYSNCQDLKLIPDPRCLTDKTIRATNITLIFNSVIIGEFFEKILAFMEKMPWHP